jgi:UPF0716 protein FxsA
MPLIIWIALFLAVPLLELWLLIEVGSLIGGLWTVLLVVITAVVGVAQVRIQGFHTLARVQQLMARGEPPAFELMEAAALLMSGLLLLIPGFVTDFLGFLLLIPPFRRWLLWHGLRRAGIQIMAVGVTPNDAGRDQRHSVVEGESRRIPPDKP